MLERFIVIGVLRNLRFHQFRLILGILVFFIFPLVVEKKYCTPPLQYVGTPLNIRKLNRVSSGASNATALGFTAFAVDSWPKGLIGHFGEPPAVKTAVTEDLETSQTTTTSEVIARHVCWGVLKTATFSCKKKSDGS